MPGSNEEPCKAFIVPYARVLEHHFASAATAWNSSTCAPESCAGRPTRTGCFPNQLKRFVPSPGIVWYPSRVRLVTLLSGLQSPSSSARSVPWGG